MVGNALPIHTETVRARASLTSLDCVVYELHINTFKIFRALEIVDHTR